jgi:ribonucleotide monophosphatase NagD (HAD superfamily)
VSKILQYKSWSYNLLAYSSFKLNYCDLHKWEPNAEEEISKLHNEARYNNLKSSPTSSTEFLLRIKGGERRTMLGEGGLREILNKILFEKSEENN